LSSKHHWAIVLAAGEGTRLRELTTSDGVATPKQFCSLRGGRTLLGEALARARRVVPRKRVVVVVAAEHRCFWERELATLPAENVIVQPANRGTAAGLLLPLLAILERDPEARVAVLPSDHFVARENVLGASLRIALESLELLEEGITLLGITPDVPESGYGWIVPTSSREFLRPVQSFVEKPDPAHAGELLARGGVWNSFLFAAAGSTLVRCFEERLPELLVRMRAAFSGSRTTRAERVQELYDELGSHDFSREILQGNEPRLRLEVVPPCGWTDLGTFERVAACLAGLGLDVDSPLGALPASRGAVLDLGLAVRLMRSSLETAALTA